MCEPRHRHEEWLKFLKLINRETPKHLALHLIVDNYGTHSHPQVQAWLERFFRDISENCIKCDSFTSVAELELAIDLYIADHNARPKPFIWTTLRWRSSFFSVSTIPVRECAFARNFRPLSSSSGRPACSIANTQRRSG